MGTQSYLVALPVGSVHNPPKIRYVLIEHVQERLAEPDGVHGNGDGIGKGEHEADSAAETGSKASGEKISLC